MGKPSYLQGPPQPARRLVQLLLRHPDLAEEYDAQAVVERQCSALEKC